MKKIGVVVTLHAEPREQLAQCFASLKAQSVEPVIVAVVDGRAEPFEAPPDVVTIVLPEAHADFGNAARVIGSVEAISRGVDFLAWLDADNWFARNHLAEMLARWTETGAPVITASRILVRVDGSELYRDSECDGAKHVDTSCFFLHRQAFALAPLWGYIPRELSAISDRIFWRILKAGGMATQHCWTPTVFYRSRYAAHYQALGEAPPKDARGIERLTPGRVTIGPPFNVNLEVR
jgi:hypothetical protein